MKKNHDSTCAFCSARKKILILSFCKKILRKKIFDFKIFFEYLKYIFLYYFANFRALYMILQICWVVLISAVIDRSDYQLQLPNMLCFVVVWLYFLLSIQEACLDIISSCALVSYQCISAATYVLIWDQRLFRFYETD